MVATLCTRPPCLQLQQQVAQLQQQVSKSAPAPPPIVSAPGLTPHPSLGAPGELQQWQFLAREQHKRMQGLRQQLGESQARVAHLEAQLRGMQSYALQQQQQSGGLPSLTLRASLSTPFATALQQPAKHETGPAAGAMGMRGVLTQQQQPAKQPPGPSHTEPADGSGAAAAASQPGVGESACPNPFADFSASLGRGQPQAAAPQVGSRGPTPPPQMGLELHPDPQAFQSSNSPAATNMPLPPAAPQATQPNYNNSKLEVQDDSGMHGAPGARYLLGLNRVSSPISRWIDDWGDSMSGPVLCGTSPVPAPPPAPAAVMRELTGVRPPPAFWQEAMLAAHGSGQVGGVAQGGVAGGGAGASLGHNMGAGGMGGGGLGGGNMGIGGMMGNAEGLAGASTSVRMQPWWLSAAREATTLNASGSVPKEEQ